MDYRVNFFVNLFFSSSNPSSNPNKQKVNSTYELLLLLKREVQASRPLGLKSQRRIGPYDIDNQISFIFKIYHKREAQEVNWTQYRFFSSLINIKHPLVLQNEFIEKTTQASKLKNSYKKERIIQLYNRSRNISGLPL